CSSKSWCFMVQSVQISVNEVDDDGVGVDKEVRELMLSLFSGRPGWRCIVCIIRCKPLDIRAICIHDIDVKLVLAVRAEYDLPAGWRPRRVFIASPSACEQPEA